MDNYLAYHGLAAGGGQPVAHLKRQFVIAYISDHRFTKQTYVRAHTESGAAPTHRHVGRTVTVYLSHLFAEQVSPSRVSTSHKRS
jgi:hypothetical protein